MKQLKIIFKKILKSKITSLLTSSSELDLGFLLAGSGLKPYSHALTKNVIPAFALQEFIVSYAICACAPWECPRQSRPTALHLTGG